MPSATPRVDASVSWPRCERPGCGATHLPQYDCPPRGKWLISRQRVDTGRPCTVTPILHAPSRRDGRR